MVSLRFAVLCFLAVFAITLRTAHGIAFPSVADVQQMDLDTLTKTFLAPIFSLAEVVCVHDAPKPPADFGNNKLMWDTKEGRLVAAAQGRRHADSWVKLTEDKQFVAVMKAVFVRLFEATVAGSCTQQFGCLKAGLQSYYLFYSAVSRSSDKLLHKAEAGNLLQAAKAMEGCCGASRDAGGWADCVTAKQLNVLLEWRKDVSKTLPAELSYGLPWTTYSLLLRSQGLTADELSFVTTHQKRPSERGLTTKLQYALLLLFAEDKRIQKHFGHFVRISTVNANDVIATLRSPKSPSLTNLAQAGSIDETTKSLLERCDEHVIAASKRQAGVMLALGRIQLQEQASSSASVNVPVPDLSRASARAAAPSSPSASASAARPQAVPDTPTPVIPDAPPVIPDAPPAIPDAPPAPLDLPTSTRSVSPVAVPTAPPPPPPDALAPSRGPAALGGQSFAAMIAARSHGLKKHDASASDAATVAPHKMSVAEEMALRLHKKKGANLVDVRQLDSIHSQADPRPPEGVNSLLAAARASMARRKAPASAPVSGSSASVSAATAARSLPQTSAKRAEAAVIAARDRRLKQPEEEQRRAAELQKQQQLRAEEDRRLLKQQEDQRRAAELLQKQQAEAEQRRALQERAAREQKVKTRAEEDSEFRSTTDLMLSGLDKREKRTKKPIVQSSAHPVDMGPSQPRLFFTPPPQAMSQQQRAQARMQETLQAMDRDDRERDARVDAAADIRALKIERERAADPSSRSRVVERAATPAPVSAPPSAAPVPAYSAEATPQPAAPKCKRGDRGCELFDRSSWPWWLGGSA